MQGLEQQAPAIQCLVLKTYFGCNLGFCKNKLAGLILDIRGYKRRYEKFLDFKRDNLMRNPKF
jgi:hypothetical protein